MRIEKTVNGTEYVYEESLWSGGKRWLAVNGIPAGRISAKKFAVTGANGAIEYIMVKGNLRVGITLETASGKLVLVKNEWFDWTLIFLPIISIAIAMWNSSNEPSVYWTVGCFMSLFCYFAVMLEIVVARCISSKARGFVQLLIVSVPILVSLLF